MKFKIINGKIVDPTQNLNCERKTVYVSDGFIVTPSKKELTRPDKTSVE